VDRPLTIALVSCVKTKRTSSAAARDLYVSPYFLALRQYAQGRADRWYILSAKYGLLSPKRVVAPYELTLNRMSKGERASWAEGVIKQLTRALPPQATVILLAGVRYREGIEGYLRVNGYDVEVPLKGLTFGRQLQWLSKA
jgi:hypothetical protein